jgi:bifunctional non-homologous end joining protein LigD
MLWRVRNSPGRPLNAPAAFIHPCQPIVAKQPPSGPGWAHELKHDGYRLQIHMRDGRVRWSGRYPPRINVTAIMDAEVVCTDGKGVPTFETLHSRCNDHLAFACAFDLLMVGGEDLRHLPFAKRKAALRKLLKADRAGIQYVEHTEGDGAKLFKAVCKLGLEGIVSKKLDAPYKSGPSKTWIKVKNPKGSGGNSRYRRSKKGPSRWCGPALTATTATGGIPVPATAIYQPTRQKHVPRKSEAAPVRAMRGKKLSRTVRLGPSRNGQEDPAREY